MCDPGGAPTPNLSTVGQNFHATSGYLTVRAQRREGFASNRSNM